MANMFNEDGTYNKTEWKAGDKITAAKLNKIESSLEAINNNDIDRHVEADSRLDILEERMANTPDNTVIDTLEDLVNDNKDSVDLALYEINSKMTNMENRIDEEIETLNVDIITYIDKVQNEMILEVDNVESELNRRLLFDTFPDDTILDTLPMETIFEVKGFYTEGDIQKTTYKKTTRVPNSLMKNGYYVHPLVDSGNTFYMPTFGIREGEEYAISNSEILSNAYIGFGASLYLPAGKYYFDRPIDLRTKQLSLIGHSMSSNPDLNIIGSTSMFFYNLLEGESALIAGAGSISNVILRGNTNSYSYTIDRSNTYVNKDNIETETINIKCSGIGSGAHTFIHNVSVSNFYYGANLDSGNIYITDFYARACHIGLSVGSDTKCKGVYGWNVHTLLEIRSSISSALQVRADSCHYLVQLIGSATSGVYLADLDGDYCLGSVVRFGNGEGSHNFKGITINGVTGRHGCYNVYDSSIDNKPTSSNIANAKDVSNWAFISAESACNISGAIITLADPLLSANPLDSWSNYKTPPILYAHGSGICIITFIMNFLNDYGADGTINITKSGLLETLGLLSGYANAARIRLDMPSGTYYVRKVNPYQIDVTKNTTEVVN